MVYSKPDFNSSSSFALSRVEKVTTRTNSLVSVILNVPTPVESVMISFVDQVSCRFISQLIKDISRVLQKLLKNFDGAAISTSCVLPARDSSRQFCLEFECLKFCFVIV